MDATNTGREPEDRGDRGELDASEEAGWLEDIGVVVGGATGGPLDRCGRRGRTTADEAGPAGPHDADGVEDRGRTLRGGRARVALSERVQAAGDLYLHIDRLGR